MAINTTGAVASPLTVFGSWVTEVAPEAVPENCSPDCGDVAYSPSELTSRPALDAVFQTPFPAGGPNNRIPTVTYQKSFKTPTGVIKNLYLDSNGQLWVENLTASPGTYTLLLQTTPGSYARSVTMFGREYIAISDGLHGAEVPLQYDGTNLDRYTSDGPGAPPTVASVALASSALAGSGGTPTVGSVTYLTLVTGGNGYGIPGNTVFLTFSGGGGAGAAGYGTIGYLGAIIGLTLTNGGTGYTSAPGISISGTGGGFAGTAAISSGGGGTSATSLTRLNNVVTGTTTAAHNLQVGFLGQISSVTAAVVGTSISSIVINNGDNPGIATVTTTTAHGLAPGNDVTITGVTAAAVGGAIVTASRQGGLVTLQTTTAHKLIPGSVVTIAGVTDTTFNTSITVQLTPSPTTIVYAQVDTDSTSSGGTVSITWPVPDNTPTPTYFEVLAAPTATTFQVQVSYSDGTWSSGSVGFPWDGKFYISSVPSPTTFTYQQYGPNASTTSAGTVAPFGQIAPGLHLCQVLWLTRQGAIPAPSPPFTVEASGGQYFSVTNIPIGPSYVTARILAFTGAYPNVPGQLPPFFYIPAIPQVEGQPVGTSTIINDNTTTSALLDFSDNTLYASLCISIPGNNLAAQIVMDGALGFGDYESRLTTWGQRNKVDNFLNMGFDGGYIATAPNNPLGWGNGAQALVTGRISGFAAQIQCSSVAGAITSLTQSAYIDAYGKPITTGGVLYRIRAWVKADYIGATGGDFVAILNSTSTGFIKAASIANASLSTSGAWVEKTFAGATPSTIPNDLQFWVGVRSNGVVRTLTIDDVSLIYADNPYIEDRAFASYIENPEGIDGFTGQFGAQDPSKLMDMAILRDTLYLLTQAPSGRLHETNGSAVNEPSGWQISEVAANCGTLSAFGLTHSQADDTAASGGDDWMAWPDEGGVQIFGGGQPAKISQEIQPNWNDPSRDDTTIQINMTAAKTIWGVNDPVQRILMFGVPIGTATAPNKIYVLNYRNLGNDQAIAGSPPFHPSMGGKLVATDNSRKWAPWNISANTAARMYRAAGVLSLVLGGGNGQTPGAAAGFGNVYTLNPHMLTDDDYGQIYPFYTTAFLPDAEKAGMMGLKGGRILMAYILAYTQGVGNITATYYPDSLDNPWPLTTVRELTSIYRDREFGGGQCTGNRIAVKFASSPITGTDNGFTMTRFTAFLKDAKLLIAGANK